MKTRCNNKENLFVVAGFTLVELCIVIIVSGLVFVSLFKLYTSYLNQQKISVTQNNMVAAEGAMGDFFGNNARYPCPADRSLQSNNANFMREAGAGGACIPGVTAGIPAVGACNASGGICVVAGASAPSGNPNKDAIIIGALPIATISGGLAPGSAHIGSTLAYDGWDRQYLYAVTVNETIIKPTDLAGNLLYNGGTIAAIDENGVATAGVNNDAFFVILSHGPDGNGAWTKEGKIYSACGAIGAAKDNENCDDTNATFVEAIVNNFKAGAMHFDDYVYFMKSAASSLWAQQANTTNIYNTNSGKIGIGTTAPAEALDVEVPDTTAATPKFGVKANNNTLATQICDKTGTDCFPITNITGAAGMSCPAGQVMTGISAGVAQCTALSFAHAAVKQCCGDNQAQCDADCGSEPSYNGSWTCIMTGRWVSGIKSDGTLTCSD